MDLLGVKHLVFGANSKEMKVLHTWLMGLYGMEHLVVDTKQMEIGEA